MTCTRIAHPYMDSTTKALRFAGPRCDDDGGPGELLCKGGIGRAGEFPYEDYGGALSSQLCSAGGYNLHDAYLLSVQFADPSINPRCQLLESLNPHLVSFAPVGTAGEDLCRYKAAIEVPPNVDPFPLRTIYITIRVGAFRLSVLDFGPDLAGWYHVVRFHVVNVIGFGGTTNRVYSTWRKGSRHDSFEEACANANSVTIVGTYAWQLQNLQWAPNVGVPSPDFDWCFVPGPDHLCQFPDPEEQCQSVHCPYAVDIEVALP